MTAHFAEIKTCAYSHLYSSVGGAIFICNTNFQVDLSLCYFDDCNSTTFRQTTSRKEDIPGGGACHFDINTINISNVFTEHCHANYLGHSIYCCFPDEKKFFVRCLADAFSAKTESTCQLASIFAFDDGYPILRDINISYPQDVNYVGALLIGHDPHGSSLMYSSVVFGDICRSTAIGFTLTNDYQNKAEYVHVQHAQGQEDQGIFTFWYGHHTLSHFYLIDCSGVFDYLRIPPQSIVIRDSFLPSNLIVHLDIENPINNTQSFPIFNQCEFYMGVPATCFNGLRIHSIITSIPSSFYALYVLSK